MRPPTPFLEGVPLAFTAKPRVDRWIASQPCTASASPDYKSAACQSHTNRESPVSRRPPPKKNAIQANKKQTIQGDKHQTAIQGGKKPTTQGKETQKSNPRKAQEGIRTPRPFLAPSVIQASATPPSPFRAGNFEAPRPAPGDLRHRAGVHGAQQLAPGRPRRGVRCCLPGEKDPHGEPEEKNTFRVPRGELLVTASLKFGPHLR